METQSTSVLIVGGGLVGLSAALFLAARGIPAILVERHHASSPLPRAIGFTTRTMELFRSVGLGDRIPQVPTGFGGPRRIKVESLAGKWAGEEMAWTPSRKPEAPPEYSVCTAAAIPQDQLEPILRSKATELGADIRHDTTMISFEQDSGSVITLLRQSDGTKYTVRAQYMIAADGHSSPIRGALGISQSGRGHMRTVRSILFRAKLEHYLESGVSQFEIQQPGLDGMLTTYRDVNEHGGRWLLIFSDNEKARDEDFLQAMIKKAIGKNDVKFEIIASGLWELKALIADRFSSGRVFLAGDSAHTLPPARGGYGANTGIEDAHNIAWKLDSVVSGTSRPELLDTYDAERRPIAWLRHNQIFARPDYERFANAEDKLVSIIDDTAMELGQIYRSAAVNGVGAELPAAQSPAQWAGQPGTRAPHVWVVKDGERVSTLDLVQPDWVLLSEDTRWTDLFRATAAKLNLKFTSVLINSSDIIAEGNIRKDGNKIAGPEPLTNIAGTVMNTMVDPAVFGKAFGLEKSGAALIRPDGYIAWRSVAYPHNPIEDLEAMLRELVFAMI